MSCLCFTSVGLPFFLRCGKSHLLKSGAGCDGLCLEWRVQTQRQALHFPACSCPSGGPHLLPVASQGPCYLWTSFRVFTDSKKIKQQEDSGFPPPRQRSLSFTSEFLFLFKLSSPLSQKKCLCIFLFVCFFVLS